MTYYILPKKNNNISLNLILQSDQTFEISNSIFFYIKWILSFSDGNLCGDGTIYRASGFKLIGVNKNTSTYQMPNGEVVCSLTSSAHRTKESNGKSGTSWIKDNGGKKLDGFQIRYIYLIDKANKITVPILPFSKIDEMGAGMYKGEKLTMLERKLSDVVDSNSNSNLVS